MTKLAILEYPDPRLRKTAERVEAVDDAVRQLAADLLETMYSANGVGLAIAEAWLAARYNRPGHKIVGHYTYAECGDGDLMEGISEEAASLAGHLRLGKLIYLYDQNHISLAGATEIDFTENVAKRFEACGWHTRIVRSAAFRCCAVAGRGRADGYGAHIGEPAWQLHGSRSGGTVGRRRP